MLKGNIKFFNQAKGFGFIIEEGTGKEVFFHNSAVKGKAITMNDNDKAVTFEKVEGKKGPEAADVKLV